MMEAGWSAKQVAHQFGRTDCFVRKCWNQWIREMSFRRRPGSRRSRQTSRREDGQIVRNTRVQPTASFAAIQEQFESSLGAPVSSRTIRRHLAKGHLEEANPPEDHQRKIKKSLKVGTEAHTSIRRSIAMHNVPAKYITQESRCLEL
ncbi:UNVERIFIED_CONTAM: hypothetical protein NCL1_49422 [Trichonephila clavipes]